MDNAVDANFLYVDPNSLTSVANGYNKCPYCGNVHYNGELCSKISAIEYNEDGTIKRIEFHREVTPPPIFAPNVIPNSPSFYPNGLQFPTFMNGQPSGSNDPGAGVSNSHYINDVNISNAVGKAIERNTFN